MQKMKQFLLTIIIVLTSLCVILGFNLIEARNAIQTTYNQALYDAWEANNPPMYDYQAMVNNCVATIANKDGSEQALAYKDAIYTNIKCENMEFLAPIVVAIRYAENGGNGREYGILHPRVEPTYRSQAGWCSATVQKNYDRWQPIPNGDTPEAFITFLGSKYCPIGADNDPNNLNQHWVKNVTYYYNQIVEGK